MMKALKFAVFFILLAVLFQYSSCKTPPSTSALPNAPLIDVGSGQKVSLSTFAGKPLIVNFWATWCGPCREEIPMLNELHKKYEGKIAILGVSTDAGGADAVNSFVKSVPIHYPSFLQTEELEQKFGGVWALPTNYFYDKNGKQLAKVVGLQPREFFEQKIREMLN